MSKTSEKKTPPNAVETKSKSFHWDIKPEPRATPRDRLWLAVSVTALLACMAALVWLAYR